MGDLESYEEKDAFCGAKDALVERAGGVFRPRKWTITCPFFCLALEEFVFAADYWPALC